MIFGILLSVLTLFPCIWGLENRTVTPGDIGSSLQLPSPWIQPQSGVDGHNCGSGGGNVGDKISFSFTGVAFYYIARPRGDGGICNITFDGETTQIDALDRSATTNQWCTDSDVTLFSRTQLSDTQHVFQIESIAASPNFVSGPWVATPVLPMTKIVYTVSDPPPTVSAPSVVGATIGAIIGGTTLLVAFFIAGRWLWIRRNDAKLPSGQYKIENARHHALAVLPNDNDGEPIHAGTDKDTGIVWNVTRLSNWKYHLQNAHESFENAFADIPPRPRKEETVGGRRVGEGARRREWFINIGGSKNNLTISPDDARHLFWGLSDGASGTPITLSDNPGDQQNHWRFDRVGNLPV